MNPEEPFRNQAERLKRRIEKINEKNIEGREQLPPREQVHREKRKKTKLKLKYPIIRLLVMFFILLPIVIFSLYSYLEGEQIKRTEKVSGGSSGYEIINVEKDKVDAVSEQVDEKGEEPALEKDGEAVPEVESQEAIEVQQPNSEAKLGGSSDGDANKQGNDKNSSSQSEPAQPKVIEHTVKQGENLYRIALKYYNSKAGEDIIRKANNIKGNEIYLGQTLKIPLEK